MLFCSEGVRAGMAQHNLFLQMTFEKWRWGDAMAETAYDLRRMAVPVNAVGRCGGCLWKPEILFADLNATAIGEAGRQSPLTGPQWPHLSNMHAEVNRLVQLCRELNHAQRLKESSALGDSHIENVEGILSGRFGQVIWRAD